METIQLSQTDLKVSRVCLGTMTFGGQCNEMQSVKILEKALDLGINFVDTANVYNAGLSESILGKALAHRRKRVVLATKVRGKMGDRPDEQGLSYSAIIRQCEESLKRLQTDYFDLYYLHQPDYATPIEETLEAADRLVKEGKVRYPASSNYSGWQVTELLWESAKKGYRPPVVTQPMYNLLARGIEQEYLPMCQHFNLSNVVYNPLAGGLLTGKQKREAPAPGTRFDSNKMYLDRYWHPSYFDAVDTLSDIAAAAGVSLVSLSLTWLLRNTPVQCVILGASRIDQLVENVNAIGSRTLEDKVILELDAVWAALRGVTPKYNR